MASMRLHDLVGKAFLGRYALPNFAYMP